MHFFQAIFQRNTMHGESNWPSQTLHIYPLEKNPSGLQRGGGVHFENNSKWLSYPLIIFN